MHVAQTRTDANFADVFHERPGGHLLNDRLGVSRRIIVRSGARRGEIISLSLSCYLRCLRCMDRDKLLVVEWPDIDASIPII